MSQRGSWDSAYGGLRRLGLGHCTHRGLLLAQIGSHCLCGHLSCRSNGSIVNRYIPSLSQIERCLPLRCRVRYPIVVLVRERFARDYLTGCLRFAVTGARSEGPILSDCGFFFLSHHLPFSVIQNEFFHQECARCSMYTFQGLELGSMAGVIFKTGCNRNIGNNMDNEREGKNPMQPTCKPSGQNDAPKNENDPHAKILVYMPPHYIICDDVEFIDLLEFGGQPSIGYT
ncbi:hypothetical protein VNO77_27079 [Canavalia gladiata]|uniref:Uncharacterized protein n=1 Tax=Canavalia gladiata TaxID=3824 RepID=A0AAN9Q3W3_CANGL